LRIVTETTGASTGPSAPWWGGEEVAPKEHISSAGEPRTVAPGA